MFQLFQTRDGSVFFIVTLVYTCRAFFAVSLENNCPIYCFGDSLSQSVSHWNSFSPLNYIVYKCFSCFRPGMGRFFSLSHLSTLVALVCFIIRKYLFPLKYIVYKCYCCFNQRMGHFCSDFRRDGHKIFLYNKLCSKCQRWRRYLLQLSRRYGVTKMQPSGNLLSFYAVSIERCANEVYTIKQSFCAFWRSRDTIEPKQHLHLIPRRPKQV